MNDRFTDLLNQLSTIFELPLRVDKNGASAIQVKQGLIVQMQPDSTAEKLIIGCKVVEVPPGKFRENVLKEALRANGMSDPRVGIFSYIAQINQLFLFQQYPFDILNGERLSGLIGPFIQTAETWRAAILIGQAAPAN